MCITYYYINTYVNVVYNDNIMCGWVVVFALVVTSRDGFETMIPLIRHPEVSRCVLRKTDRVHLNIICDECVRSKWSLDHQTIINQNLFFRFLKSNKTKRIAFNCFSAVYLLRLGWMLWSSIIHGFFVIIFIFVLPAQIMTYSKAVMLSCVVPYILIDRP